MWRTLIILLWWLAECSISTFISYDIYFSRYSLLVLISPLKWTSSLFQTCVRFASTDYLRKAGFTNTGHLSRKVFKDLSNSKKYVARLVAFGLTKGICLKTTFKKLHCDPPPRPSPTPLTTICIYFWSFYFRPFNFRTFYYRTFYFQPFYFRLKYF